jgi:hypothetical protein
MIEQERLVRLTDGFAHMNDRSRDYIDTVVRKLAIVSRESGRMIGKLARQQPSLGRKK